MIEEIKQFVASGEFRLTRHAAEEIAEESITLSELLESLLSGEIIEDYPAHRRGHCCLVSGTTNEGRPLHSVCTIGRPRLLIITVYEPMLPKWITPKQRRETP